MTVASFALPQMKNPAFKPGSSFRKTSFPTIPNFFERASEMAEQSSENAAKASVTTRDQTLYRVRKMVRDLGGDAESVKARLRQAARHLDGIMKPSRVRDIWHGDARVRVRADEHDNVLAKWERWLEREERRLSEAAANARQLLESRRGRYGASGDTATADVPAAAPVAADRAR